MRRLDRDHRTQRRHADHSRRQCFSLADRGNRGAAGRPFATLSCSKCAAMDAWMNSTYWWNAGRNSRTAASCRPQQCRAGSGTTDQRPDRGEHQGTRSRTRHPAALAGQGRARHRQTAKELKGEPDMSSPAIIPFAREAQSLRRKPASATMRSKRGVASAPHRHRRFRRGLRPLLAFWEAVRRPAGSAPC